MLLRWKQPQIFGDSLWSVGCEHVGFAGHHGAEIAVLKLDTFLWLLQR